MNKKFAVYLPEEILTNIFLKLGVKSLLRCKSVCKLWLSVISNPQFVECQLRHAVMSPTLLVIHYYGGYAASLLCRKSWVNPFPRLVLPCLLKNCEVISCSYNGIICLCDDKDVFYLWNPSIREFKRLPPAPPRRLAFAKYDKIGFGYDSISNDYKIIRIVGENLSDDVLPKVHLYSSNTDSWKRFEDTTLKRLSRCGHTDIVVNGVLYMENGTELILFDLHREVFRVVALPGFIETKMSNLLDFEGSVGMIFKSVGDVRGIYLWTLDDVSGQVQWTKRFRIKAYSNSRLWLYCYLGAGEFYGNMSPDQSFFLHNILYNYETEETKIYGVQENVCATVEYTQTLVSLDGFEPLN